MIEVKVNEGKYDGHIEGRTIVLLAESIICIAGLLGQILNELPEEIREDLIKHTFEQTLEELKKRGVY